MAAGKLVIETGIDDSGFNRDLSKLEKKQNIKKMEVELALDKLDAARDKYAGLVEETEIYENKITEINNKIKEQENLISKITTPNESGTGVKIPMENMAAYSNAVESMQSLKIQSTQYRSELRQANEEVAKQGSVVDSLNVKYQKQKNQLEEINAQLKKSSFTNMETSISNVGKGMTKVLSQVKRWALAIFGIRSAYMLLRKSMATLSEHNQQLGADIQYIRNALAFAMEPIIIRIVELVKRLLYYIAYIIKVWTGKNIFANANKSLKSANAQAKKLQKTIAGFDEMNVLNDNSDAGGGGGDVGPSFDLSNLEGKVPWWIEWIAKNKDIVLSMLAGILTFLKVAGPLIEAFGLKLGLIKALGIGLAIAGIVYAIQGLIAYLKDPSFENFGKIITGIGVAITGVAIAIGAWPVAVAGAVVAILGIIISNWEKIKAFLQSGIDWLTGKSDWIHEHLGKTIGNIYDFLVSTFQNILNWLDSIFTNAKKILDGIIQFVKGVFTGNWKQAWEGIKNIFIGIWNVIKSTFVTVFNFIKGLVITVGQTVGNIISGAFKAAVNGVLSAIEKILNAPIRAINKMIKVINKVPGINIGKLDTFNLPRLAHGGIVNNPGPGVMMGNYIAGERGPEAVIPLDDMTLDRLGEAFARHTQINANIINTMNGRVISRELQKINGENNFAFNS